MWFYGFKYYLLKTLSTLQSVHIMIRQLHYLVVHRYVFTQSIKILQAFYTNYYRTGGTCILFWLSIYIIIYVCIKIYVYRWAGSNSPHSKHKNLVSMSNVIQTIQYISAVHVYCVYNMLSKTSICNMVLCFVILVYMQYTFFQKPINK